MSPELIGSILGGLTALVTAIGAILATRTRRVEDDQRLTRAELAHVTRQLQLYARYTRRLQLALSTHDLPVPDPPEGLGDDPDDELDKPPARSSRRHRA